jgi:hypothetical protein
MEFKHPMNGTSYRFNGDANFDQWFELNQACKQGSYYEDWINRQEDISATMKNVLKDLVKFTVKVGSVVLRIGKIVLNIVMKIILQFPNTIAGILLGFIFGLICSSIPFLGWLLGPIMTPLFALAGGIIGFMADMSNKITASGLEGKIRSKIMEDFAMAGFKPV